MIRPLRLRSRRLRRLIRRLRLHRFLLSCGCSTRLEGKHEHKGFPRGDQHYERDQGRVADAWEERDHHGCPGDVAAEWRVACSRRNGCFTDRKLHGQDSGDSGRDERREDSAWCVWRGEVEDFRRQGDCDWWS